MFFPETRWRPKKKVYAENWSVFSLKSSEDQKKKRSSPQFGTIFGIYSCWLALDRFIIQGSNLDGWTSKSRWGTLNLDGETRPPYNLSADCTVIQTYCWRGSGGQAIFCNFLKKKAVLTSLDHILHVFRFPFKSTRFLTYKANWKYKLFSLSFACNLSPKHV